MIVHNPGARAPFLLICDHAGRRIPRRLGDLGLSAADLVRHIAWDIGAAGLARRLADLLEAELVLQAYSRLVADCNRDPASADVAPDVSDGSPIPGNAYLDEALLRARINEIHVPYHAAIAAALDLKGRRTALVSIHSFTPQMQRVARPWHVGVLHEQDSPASDRMLEVLTKSGDFVVGDNQPYAMNGQDYTIPLHTKGRGIDYLELEIRQDLILDDQGQARMARWLAPLVSSALAVG